MRYTFKITPFGFIICNDNVFIDTAAFIIQQTLMSFLNFGKAVNDLYGKNPKHCIDVN